MACKDRKVAAQGSDFVVHNVSGGSEVMRLRCGGWRRAMALAVGGADRITFAYLEKDRTIHVHRCLPFPAVCP